MSAEDSPNTVTDQHPFGRWSAAHRRQRWVLPALLVVVWLGVGGGLGSLGGKLADVVDSSTSAYLPRGAEATKALELNREFGDPETLPAVIVYTRDGGLSAADSERIDADVSSVQLEFGDVVSGRVIGPIPSEDGAAVQVVVPFRGSESAKIAPLVEQIRDRVLSTEEGLKVHVTGPAGVQTDMLDALGQVDLMLVAVTSAVILLILVTVYRSPVLPLLVLFVAGIALGTTQGVIYLLAEAGSFTVGPEVQGILNVLVLGAATDYALLLIARYREELARQPDTFAAMQAAWRASVGPIIASAATVALGLLCLLISDLGSNRGLGPTGAIGIGCALIAMLTLLPAVLLLFGRTAFWPASAGRSTDTARGVWAIVARWVDHRPRLLWVGAAVVLAVLSLGVFRLDASGIPDSEMILTEGVDSALGQAVLAAHYPAGAGNPAIVMTEGGRVDEVVAAVRGIEGVAEVTPYPGGSAGSAEPAVVNGLSRVDATLDEAPDSDRAMQIVRDLRAAVHDIPGTEVGGFTAVKLDFNSAAARDRVVLPLLLVVVMLVIAVLLRAVVAALLLLGTVVLSYLATLGVSAVVFHDLLDFSGVDATYPVLAFVFLVALGVDYNIFLMTRVREESERVGTRRGALAGLVSTGGVITSAGVVLAATFAALALLPLAIMVQLAFTVAFGVLLDTLLVRSILVPALAIDVGRRIWWPSMLSREPDRPRADPPVANGPVAGSPVLEVTAATVRKALDRGRPEKLTSRTVEGGNHEHRRVDLPVSGDRPFPAAGGVQPAPVQRAGSADPGGDRG